jgi:hypothetical protein
MKKKILSFFIVLVLLTLFGCSAEENNNEKEIASNYYKENDYLTVDKSRLYGIAEPFYEKRTDNDNFQVIGFNSNIAIDLLKATGTKTIRLMLPQSIFTKYAMYGENDFEIELDSDIVAYFKNVIKDLIAAGINHIICEAAIYPKPEGFNGGYVNLSVPERDDECYYNWCLLMQKQWQIIAATFNEITYFEMGNETNTHSYMSKYSGETYSLIELAAINTDLMYYASKGIKEGNSKAYSVTPGFSSLGTMSVYSDELTSVGYSIALFVEEIYKNIISGNFPYGENKSADVDDYFQAIAYHPYELTHWQDFSANNKRLYSIIEKYDDVKRKVFITEMGWADNNENSLLEEQIIKINQLYSICKNELDFIESVCYFRLFNCKYASNWGSFYETTYGLFNEPDNLNGFVPKMKATEIKKIFGGAGDLDMWSDIKKLNSKLGYEI